MARYSGKLGFVQTVETTPGIWKEQVTERNYIGDMLKCYRRSSDVNINDEISISNQISVVSDAFLDQNLFALRYVSFMGTNWKVASVDVQRPRLIISLGGIYTNGQ